MNINDFELENIITNIIKKQESRETVISVIDQVALIGGPKRVKFEETFEFTGTSKQRSAHYILPRLGSFPEGEKSFTHRPHGDTLCPLHGTPAVCINYYLVRFGLLIAFFVVGPFFPNINCYN